MPQIKSPLLVKHILSLIFFSPFFTLSAFGAPTRGDMVTVDIILKRNNKVISKPKVLIKNGHTATFTQAYNSGKPQISVDISPEMLPREKNTKEDFFRISFKLRQLRGSLVQELSEPQVVVANGRTAVLTQKSKEGEDLELIITPRIKRK